ncbi:MAG: hypothetical protein AB7H80_07820 [Candidatus Kapaibacterium sp.]
MNQRRCQHIRLSPPFRAGNPKSNSSPSGAACGFPHDQSTVLPSGAAR